MRIVLLAALAALPALAGQARLERPNVLFIAVDDLNHWVGYLKRNPQTKTPNIDRLAARGVSFTRSYCAAPVCNPSRTALLSGLRPSTTGVYDNNTDFRPLVSEDLTLITAFRKAGWFTAGAGKIYHGGFDRKGEWEEYFAGGGGGKKENAPGGVDGIRFAPLDCADSEIGDYKITDYIIGQLAKKHEKPFLLTLGLHKPHMPWNVPKKYYDLFPLDSIQLPPTQKGDLDDLPAAGKKMARPEGDHAAILKSGRWKEAVQAYLAAIAFTDMNIGRVLEALDKSAYRENTIICFWGDHGWHLGEKEHWRKFALWEEATRAPLLFVAPGVTKPGGVCERTVDFMSLYPTLCDLAGIEIPKHVEGPSIRKLLENPAAEWDRAALTTHGANNHGVRTEGWRYIRYADGGEELYDETKDPYEWANLAGVAEHAPRKAELAKFLPTKNAPVGGRKGKEKNP